MLYQKEKRKKKERKYHKIDIISANKISFSMYYHLHQDNFLLAENKF